MSLLLQAAAEEAHDAQGVFVGRRSPLAGMMYGSVFWFLRCKTCGACVCVCVCVCVRAFAFVRVCLYACCVLRSRLCVF